MERAHRVGPFHDFHSGEATMTLDMLVIWIVVGGVASLLLLALRGLRRL